MASGISSLLGSAGIGGAIGKAIVSLELDTKKYAAEMKAAEGQTVASTSKMSAAFGAIGIAAVAGIAFAIKAGSDLNEQTNRSSVIFGDASRAVLDFSKTAASSFGIAQSEALEAAGNFGQLFDAAGFAGKAAADMSVKMVKLSADLGSFNNIPVAEALEKIRSGLSGEAEPLRQLGVFLSEARVETEAYASGIAKQGAELTDAQKIQARYNLILQDTTKAQGDFARTVGESLPNQLKVLKAELTDVAADLGTALLPIALDVVKTFKVLAPILRIVGENADLVLEALVGFAAVKYLPVLINAMAAAFVKLQVAAGASFAAQGAASTVFAGIATGVPYVTAAVLLLANAWKVMSEEAQRANASLTEGINFALEEFSKGSADADANLLEFGAHFAAVTGNVNAANATLNATQLAIAGLRSEFVQGDITQGEFAQGLGVLGLSVADVNRIIRETTNGAENFTHHIDRAGRTVQNFANLTNKEMKDFKAGVVESVQVTAGEFDKLNDAFATTPKELQKQMDLAVQIARREHRVLREIFSDKSLTDGQKEALASLPADQRDAWARAGEAGKKQIVHDAIDLKRLNAQNFKQITGAAKGPAKEGGKETGAALMTGAALGVDENSQALAEAVRLAVRDAILAGKREAGAESPSKEMRKLGLDMMTGLYQGITSGAQKVIDAATKEIQKLIDKSGSELDKVKGKAQSFADSIKAGFSGFADIAGLFSTEEGGRTDISAILGEQVSKAQELARILQTLRTQGASQATLAQVAGAGAEFGRFLLQGGPDLVGQMNDSLKTISDLANQTGKGLSEHFFGERIDKLEAKLERQNEILRDIREIERLGHGHAIILNGQELGKAVRDELVKIGNQNGNALG